MKKYILCEITVREPLTGDAHFEIPDCAEVVGVQEHDNIDGWKVFYIVEDR
jgi:hypothetical protein